jgi:hypothetical protein
MADATRGLDEAWIPVPERLLDDVLSASSEKRRVWAIAYLIMWCLAFLREKRERPASLTDLKNWSQSTTHKRAIAAKEDAETSLDVWRKNPDRHKTSREGDKQGTGKGQAGDKQGTSGVGQEPDESSTLGQAGDKQGTGKGQAGDKQGTAHGRAVRKTQDRDSTGTAQSISSIWDELEQHRASLFPGQTLRAWSLSRTRKALLKSRLADGMTLDGLKGVWTWWFTADHPRAVFLRENGMTSDTVLRHAVAYLEMASAPGKKTAQRETARRVETEAAAADAAWQRIEESYHGE